MKGHRQQCGDGQREGEVEARRREAKGEKIGTSTIKIKKNSHNKEKHEK